MDEGEEFAAWLNDLTERYPSGEDEGDGYEERHLVLTDEIGDWIGGLRYAIRGGVAQVLHVGILPNERNQGHAHRLLAAFEERSAVQGAQPSRRRRRSCTAIRRRHWRSERSMCV
jgi:GNAT superfamily N-acetyltransferase